MCSVRGVVELACVLLMATSIGGDQNAFHSQSQTSKGKVHEKKHEQVKNRGKKGQYVF